MGYFVSPFDSMVAVMHEFHFLGMVFACLVIFMLIMGKVMPTQVTEAEHKELPVDMTPWVHAKKTGLLALALVLLIYLYFADFSVLVK